MDITAAPRETLKNIEVFCCYAHEDQLLLEELKKHLMPLQRDGLITFWADTDINAGVEWEKQVHLHLYAASIILLLVSPDFMHSDYCYSVEMKHAMERHGRGEAHIIPVILRSIYWQSASFGKLQALPRDGKPVSSWGPHNLDEAFFDVAEGIRKIIEKMLDHSLPFPLASSGSSKEIVHPLEHLQVPEHHDSLPTHWNVPLFPNPHREDIEADGNETDTAKSARVFVGRQVEQKRFREVVSNHLQQQQPRKHVFLISGPGTFGKSWLVNRLCQIADADFGIPSVPVDWRQHKVETVSDVMEGLAKTVSQRFGLTFDAFYGVLEVEKCLKAKINVLQEEFSMLQNQQDEAPFEFTTYLTQHLSETQRDLFWDRTKTLSKAFMQDINAGLSTIDSVIVCFDTYELIDYRRSESHVENFADSWVQKLIQLSPDNLLFVISGRENHAEAYITRFGKSFVDSFSLRVFKFPDVYEYTRKRLGKKMGEVTLIGELARQIFAFSCGIPLLVNLAVDVVQSHPGESYRGIFGIEQGVSKKTNKEEEIRKRGVSLILQYLQKENMLLLLMCFSAILQLKSNDDLQWEALITWTFERTYPSSSVPISVIIDEASRSYSSIFLQPAVVLPELRPIIINSLLNRDISISQADLDTLLSQADSVLTDLLSRREHEMPLYDSPDDERLVEYTRLIAQRINIYAWIAPEKCINLFIKECLIRSIYSMKSLHDFIDLFAQAKLERVLPDIVREKYIHLLSDVSHTRVYEFLERFPVRHLGNPLLRCLFDVVRLYLDVLMKRNTWGGIEALIGNEEVEKKIASLEKRTLDCYETQERYHLCVGLVETYREYARVVAKSFSPSKTEERNKIRRGQFVPRPRTQVVDEQMLYQKEREILQSTIPLLVPLPPYYKNQRLRSVYFRLAQLTERLGEFDSAFTFAKKALQIMPNENSNDASITEFIGKLPMSTKKDATRLLRQTLQRIRERASVNSEDLEELEKAAKLDPENPSAYRNLIRAYRRIGEYAKALEASLELLEIDPSNISGLVGRGEVFYEQGRFDKAEHAFKLAMNLAKQSGKDAINVYTNLGHCYMMLGAYDEALRYFDKRIEDGQKKVSDLSLLLGPYDPWRFNRLIDMQNNYLKHVFNRKAFALLKIGKVDEAQHLFRLVIERDENYHEAWMGLALSKGGNNKVEIVQGIRACRRNMKRNPPKISYHFHLAILHLLNNVYTEEECLKVFQRALSETKDAYGFIYEAKFFLSLISERIDYISISMQTIQEAANLLEAYIRLRRVE